MITRTLGLVKNQVHGNETMKLNCRTRHDPAFLLSKTWLHSGNTLISKIENSNFSEDVEIPQQSLDTLADHPGYYADSEGNLHIDLTAVRSIEAVNGTYTCFANTSAESVSLNVTLELALLSHHSYETFSILPSIKTTSPNLSTQFKKMTQNIVRFIRTTSVSQKLNENKCWEELIFGNSTVVRGLGIGNWFFGIFCCNLLLNIVFSFVICRNKLANYFRGYLI